MSDRRCPPFRLRATWIAATLGLVLSAPARGQAAAPPSLADEAFLFTPAGFPREGEPRWTSGPAAGQVRVVVRDAATGRVTPARVNVVGPDGHFYQPPGNRLSLYALTGAWPKPGSKGNRIGKAPFRYVGRFFYTTGDSTVPVPAGDVRVEVWKGFEYRPQTVTLPVAAGTTRQVDVSLERVAPMAPAGYYAGDSHLHLNRLNEEDDGILFDLLEAEDLRHGVVLAYNEPAGPYAGVMGTLDYPQAGVGGRTLRSRGDTWILSGQEYRSKVFGHLNLYLRDDLVFAGRRFDADDGPVFGEVSRDTMERGGLAFLAHGGYGQEIWADAALGAVSAVELLQFGVYRGIEREGWYHMLNSGYRVAAYGASDYPPCRTLADCRTYAAAPSAPNTAGWLAAVAQGRSFFTTGPLLLLDVDGQQPGGQLNRTGPGPHPVKARVRVRCEVTPVTDLDLIVNGRVVASRRVPRADGQGRWIELEHDLNLVEPAWIAARAHSNAPIRQPDAEAHTNPVYVTVDGRAPFQRAALDAWVEKIDGQIAVHTRRNFPGRAKVLAWFQRARDVLLGIRQAGGLAAAAALSNAPAGAERPAPGIRDLAADGSLSDPTDDELKAFLRPVPAPPAEVLLRTFDVAPGFQVELVAAEPLVHDPIAAAFDEDGNLYVAEMRDYPYNTNQPVKVAHQEQRPPSDGRPRGAIRRLRDVDGDGRFDESTVFADGLLWAGGIQPWKGGVFVASPPHIWYLKDTDGDGRADVREPVFTGFGTANQQGMVNSLVMGLDHHIYGSSSVNGGAIRPARDPAATPVPVDGRDFRFDPVSLRFEPEAGTRQFGLTFDDWGNRFLCSQSEPAVHAVLPLRYLERNPHFTPPAVLHRTTPQPTPVHRLSPVERWRHLRSSRRVAAGERAADSAGVSHHVVDAGAGVTVYRGGAYPKEYYGSLFVGDSVGNLVHRRVLVPEGGSFRSERAEAAGEFLRSPETWFRPVNFVNAPDGTLYCLDMAREHSETINLPADVERHLDLTSGHDRGRIFRIAPTGLAPGPAPRLSRASAAELVAALGSPHGWWRDTAHRLLFERQDRTAVPALASLLERSASPQARVHALWSLQGLAALDDRLLVRALVDPHPGVRVNAVRLAEPRLGRAAVLRDGIVRLVGDPDPHVRLQVAFAIGETQVWDQAGLLARVAQAGLGDSWTQSAVMSSAAACGGELLARLANASDVVASPAGGDLLRQLATTIGAANRPADVARALEVAAAVPDPVVALRLAGALGDGLRRGGVTLAAADRRNRLRSVLAEAPRVAADAGRPEAARTAAIAVLAHVSYVEAAPVLLGLISAVQPPAIQAAALSTLGWFRDPQVGPALLARYSGLSPALRRGLFDVVLARPERIAALWPALEGGVVRPGELTASQVAFLRRHPREDVRQRTGQFFGTAGSAARTEVLEAYRPALRLPGEAGRGRTHFENRCASCHRYAGNGREFGPDLGTVRATGKERLLTSIVDPGRDVASGYTTVTLEMRGGESVAGLVRLETSAALTLRLPGGEEKTVPRREIVSFRTSGVSLMPEGLEAGLSPQDMADLLAFLAGEPE